MKKQYSNPQLEVKAVFDVIVMSGTGTMEDSDNIGNIADWTKSQV